VLYGAALAVFKKMRDAAPRGAPVAGEDKEPIITTPPYDHETWQPGPAARSSRSQA
jgi:hypothetical protein